MSQKYVEIVVLVNFCLLCKIVSLGFRFCLVLCKYNPLFVRFMLSMFNDLTLIYVENLKQHKYRGIIRSKNIFYF